MSESSVKEEGKWMSIRVYNYGVNVMSHKLRGEITVTQLHTHTHENMRWVIHPYFSSYNLFFNTLFKFIFIKIR